MNDAPRSAATATRPPKPSREGSGARRWLYALCLLCALLLCADRVYHKHSHFQVEDLFGFYGWFAGIACTGLILAARALGCLVRRREDYYDP